MSSILQIHSLHQTYPGRETQALENINLDVNRGEFVSLTGPSGSGKSTLLRIVAGLLDATGGEVIFTGEKVKGPKCVAVPGHPEIKTVFQDFNLEPSLSLFDNVRVMLRAYKPEYARERSEVLLKTVGLWHDKDKRPNGLSGGQQQRLSIARALAEDPALLLMDEPFSNLDKLTKDTLKQEIKKHALINDTTIIFVTHDAADALSMADKVVYMQNGKIIQAAAPVEIYERPVNESVASFFGEYSVLAPGDSGVAGGLRPEYITLCPPGSGTAARITYGEYRGGGFLYHARSAAGSEIKFFSREDYKKNDTIHFMVQPEHVFGL